MTAFLALLLVPAAALGQSDPCPWFRNPAAFGSSGTGLAFKGWSARVGERVSTSSTSDTTTGYYIMSTCADPNCADITGHENITSSIYNSGADGGITCCSYENIWDANDRRFQIITSANAGLDQFTIGPNPGMQRIPAGYQTSIRLGDPRAAARQTGPTSHSWNANSSLGNKGAEALFYTLYVQPSNALLFINYAVVGRCYNHSTYQAGEFLIRVVKRNADYSWATVPINDNMWFKISAPPIASGNPPAPWLKGKPGVECNSTTCEYVYKPWAKVAISLNEFLYSWVRIELYTSDCIYNFDPIYAYICGDYQAMVLTPSGCPDPESSVVDTLSAPSDMLSYAWFVSTHGPLPDEELLNASYMDTVEFRQVWPPVEGATDTLRRYPARVEDFVLTAGPNMGDTVDKQTFKCVMMSALDPTKPFESRIYQNLSNRKPLIAYGYEAHCDTSITFVDASYSFAPEGLDDSLTYWVVYNDTLGQEPLDTILGSTANYKFSSVGKHSAKLFVTTAGDPCTAAQLFVCTTIGSAPADFTLSSDQLCESDELVLSASDAVRQVEGLSLRWAIDDSVQADTLPDVHFTMPVGKHRLSLTTITQNGCSATTYDSATVYGQPTIDLSTTVAAICEGDSVTLSAAGSIDYTWNSSPFDSTIYNIQGQSTFTVHPTVNTTYFLLPSTDNPCSIEGAEVYIEVIPYPVPTVRASRARVNKENSSLTLQDISPATASSHWQFSDGGSAEGAKVTHSFTDLSADSVGIMLHTCNRLNCCADTSFKLPVEITAVWFPNTFTPDIEGNNLFGIHTVMTLDTYEIYIYNRQGMLVYYSDDQNAPWDGTLEGGDAAPQGTYVWFCRYSYSPDATHTLRGTVTLIR